MFLNVKNGIKNDKLHGKVITWLEKNQLTEKEEYVHQKELETLVNPIISKVPQDRVPPMRSSEAQAQCVTQMKKCVEIMETVCVISRHALHLFAWVSPQVLWFFPPVQKMKVGFVVMVNCPKL